MDFTLQDGDPAGGSYTKNASAESKFEVYPWLVDPDQENDRAVDFALYSAKRPRYACLGFFVAFFNWFGIAPLMREVAHALHINRTQVVESQYNGSCWFFYYKTCGRTAE